MSETVVDIPEGLCEKLKAERLFVVSNMQKYGGSFVIALSEAILRSDAENYDRLKAAFPEIWEQYEGLGEEVSNGRETNNGEAIAGRLGDQ